jgi:hypothetical protein
MVFRGFNEQATDARFLMCRVYGELPEVAPGAAHLSVDAGDKPAGAVFSEKNAAFIHYGGETLVVGACSLKEGFDGEGGVDEGNQPRPVGLQRQADMKWSTGFGGGVCLL